MVKKLSLKEFYENHGNTKPLSSCLPTKPGDVPRDADQGYNNGHRIAEFSLDSCSHSSGNSKPYHREDAAYGSGSRHASSRSNGHHYGSSSDVHIGCGSGDIDYYGSRASYYPGRLCASGPPPAGRYGRESFPAPPPPAGSSAPVVPAAHPAAVPAGPAAAAMGRGNSFGPPAYGGHPAPPPHGPAGAGKGPYTGSGPYPAPAAPPADEDVWYPPPPPPPPRAHSSSPSGQVSAPPVPAHGFASSASTYGAAGVAYEAGGGVGSGYDCTAANRATAVPPSPAFKEQHVSPQPAEGTARPADAGALGVVPAAESRVDNDSAGAAKPPLSAVATETDTPAAHIGKPAATPFASAAPVGPKNEFAERLAARAMSHATCAKSSLLAGGGSISSSLTTALSGGGSDALGGDDSSEQGSSAFVKPAHPFGRPRLVLKPRSAVLTDSKATTPSHHGGNTSSASSDSSTDMGEQGSSASVASSHGRPRLHLQPRSLPVSEATAGGCSTASSASNGRPRLNLLPRGSSTTVADGDSGVRKPSVFGDAKPKDLPDPVLMDGFARAGSGAPSRLSEAAVARLASGNGSQGGRWDGSNSVTSGDRDEAWQTAGRGRKGGSKFSTDERSSSVQLDDDPFFGSNSRSSYVPVPAPRAFERDIMRDGKGYGKQGSGYGDDGFGGSYGRKFSSPKGNGWGGRASFDTADSDNDEGVFRRALPTRQLPLAL